MEEGGGRRVSVGAVVALLGCAAVVASFFLPWLASGTAEQEVLSPGDLRAIEESVREMGPEAEEAVAIVTRIRAGEAATGREWHHVLGFVLDHAEAQRDLAEKELRVLRVAHVSLGVLPWMAGLLALALLVGRLRPPASPVIALLFVLGLLIGGLAGLLWLGASIEARENALEDSGMLGAGLKALAVGALACLLGALVGVTRKTWWRGWGLGLLLAAALAVGTVLHVQG
jgi:hypothetical protein